MSEAIGGVLLDVHLLIERDGRTLFLERRNTGFMDGFHSLVGGRVEPGETILAAAIREAREEVGLAITEAEIRLATVVQKFGPRERLSFVFAHALPPGVEPRNLEPERCGGLVWAPRHAPPAPLVPYIALVLAETGMRGSPRVITYVEP